MATQRTSQAVAVSGLYSIMQTMEVGARVRALWRFGALRPVQLLFLCPLPLPLVKYITNPTQQPNNAVQAGGW